MKNLIAILSVLILSMLVLAGCQTSTTTTVDTMQETKVITIGSIAPLSGDASAYGLPIQRVTERAVADLNVEWASQNRKLEVRFEDGKCNGKDGLSAAQSLVNVHGIKVILGGLCSGETLGIAPFAEENKILLFSAVSSSPEITTAGDFVFRNYPSDTAQVDIMMNFIKENGWTKFAIISENTDYAQALRSGYVAGITDIGGELLSDETVTPGTQDVRTEVSKIKAGKPQVVIILPQTGTTGGLIAKQLFESGLEAVFIGNDAISFDDTLSAHGQYMQGYYFPQSYFDQENDQAYLAMVSDTNCELGYYCATSYDSVFLLGEILIACGEDTTCMKEKFYATKDWSGKFTSGVTFDSNGDVKGNFRIMRLEGEDLVVLS